MTLDEAIQHAEEVADCDCYNENQFKCAAEHSQLAEWLKELKRLREGRKQGHYVCESSGDADGYPVLDNWYCSECDCCFEEWEEKPTYNFCPNCGADMRGEQDG